MKRLIGVIACVFLSMLLCRAQSKCAFTFVEDTLSIPEKGIVMHGQSLETVLKNLSTVKLFKSNDDKLFIKFVVTENFYFDKVDVLEIRSGSKSYYAKGAKQYKINKTRGMFVIEVFKNYIVTLKDDGITSLVFNAAESDFTKQDASQIRKISICFYETIYGKK